MGVDPSRRFLYVTNRISDNVSALPSTGSPARSPPWWGGPFAAGDNPESVIIDTKGRFAYVVNAVSDTVSVFAIDQTSGALTQLVAPPIIARDAPHSIAAAAQRER